MGDENNRYGQLFQTSRHLRTGPVDLTLPIKHRMLPAAGVVKYGPVVEGDRVYVAAAESKGWSVRCVEVTSGELVWTHPFPGYPGATEEGELVLSEGAVLVNANGGVSVLDLGEGRLLREWFAGPDVVVSFGALHGSVFYVNREVVTGAGGVCAYDWLSGTVQWETGRSAGLASTEIAATDEAVLFNSNSGILECLDIVSGQRRWELDVSEIGRHVPVSDRRQKNPESVAGHLSGPLMLLDEEVVVPLGEWGLLGVGYAEGNVLWRINDDTFLRILPYTNAGCVVVSRDSRFLEFDFRKHSVEREYSSDAAERELHPWSLYGWVAEGALVLTAPRSTCIGAFSREDGSLLWKHDLGARAEGTILMSNRLFVRDALGNLSVFESA